MFDLGSNPTQPDPSKIPNQNSKKFGPNSLFCEISLIYLIQSGLYVPCKALLLITLLHFCVPYRYNERALFDSCLEFGGLIKMAK